MSHRHGASPTRTRTTPAATAVQTTDAGEPFVTRFRMRERLLSSSDEFYVETASGKRAYRIDVMAPHLRDTLTLKDMRGNETYRIQGDYARYRDMLSIHRRGEKVAVVKAAKVAHHDDRYSVKIRGASDLSIQGDILQHEYSINREGAPIAIVSSDWFQLRDAYGVEVAPGEDAALILAVTVCIDTMSQASKSRLQA